MQFSYSFDSNCGSLFIQSSHSFIQFGGLGQGGNLSGELGLIVKMAEEKHEDEDSEVKSFFKHVINRTEEILSQNSFASSEHHISEVLTHIDLLERTVILPSQLANTVTDETDVKQLNDLTVVFSELVEKFLQHSISRPSCITTVPCQTVKNGRFI